MNADIVADARRLLHVVGNHDEAVLLAQFPDQFVDQRRRDRIQGRGRFVKQEHFGLDGDGAGDTQPLLLAARQAETAAASACP